MPHHLAQSLESAVARELPNLKALSEERSSVKTSPSVWSPKEELGHLIDSAINNHVRFVRASLETQFEGPGYQQDGWVNAHGYQEWAWPELIAAWVSHNRQLVQVILRISDAKLNTPCVVGGSAAVTLRFLIEDYVLHMQHHLDHLLAREKITQYPGAAAGL